MHPFCQINPIFRIYQTTSTWPHYHTNQNVIISLNLSTAGWNSLQSNSTLLCLVCCRVGNSAELNYFVYPAASISTFRMLHVIYPLLHDYICVFESCILSICIFSFSGFLDCGTLFIALSNHYMFVFSRYAQHASLHTTYVLQHVNWM
jgi:hypothetical protein